MNRETITPLKEGKKETFMCLKTGELRVQGGGLTPEKRGTRSHKINIIVKKERNRRKKW